MLVDFVVRRLGLVLCFRFNSFLKFHGSGVSLNII